MLGNLVKSVVARLWPEEEDAASSAEAPPSRQVFNVLQPFRCKGCHKTNKVRLLIGTDDEGSLAFFDSVRDGAAWREGIPLADLTQEGGVEAYAVEDEEGS